MTPTKKKVAPLPWWKRSFSWYVIGYFVMVVALAAVVGMVRQEAKVRQEFDARRAYDLCVSGNERTKIITDAIRGVAMDGAEAAIIASEEKDPPRTQAEERERQRGITVYRNEIKRRVDKSLEPLEPRDCDALYNDVTAKGPK